MKQFITDQQHKDLTHKIYMSLINSPFIDEDGEKQERGMADMGDCEEEAQRIVNEWLAESNIFILPTSLADQINN